MNWTERGNTYMENRVKKYIHDFLSQNTISYVYLMDLTITKEKESPKTSFWPLKSGGVYEPESHISI